MKILLVSPRSDKDSINSIVQNIPYLQRSKAQIAPLAPVTVAAITPAGHEITIHDEHLKGPVDPLLEHGGFYIIGLSMIGTQYTRSLAFASAIRERRLPGQLVVGGPGTAIADKSFYNMVDTVFFGEAEHTWRAYLADLMDGRPQKFYQQVSKPDLTNSPIPRWDLIVKDIPHYLAGAVQTTRGCPFDCEFCDAIYLYGRTFRSKTIQQVLEEVRLLESMGVKDILLSDDNFAGNRSRAKDLLRALGPLNNSFKVPIRFVTQCDVTIASDEELLQLMADANLIDVLMGIESPNEKSLADLNKQQNLKVNLVEAVHKVQSYGTAVLASMIIGADSDDTDAFRSTADFIHQAHITDHVCHPLIAPRGTRLWYKMAAEKRLVEISEEWEEVDGVTNIIPKKMSRTELLEGFATYWDEVCAPLNYMERALNFIRGVTRRPQVKRTLIRSLLRHRKLLLAMIRYYLRQASPDYRKSFFTILMTTLRKAPFLMPQMLFLHTRFHINHERGKLSAKAARQGAAFERAHPEQVILASPCMPVPEKIRTNAKRICETAYLAVRPMVSDTEILYQVVLKALMEYVRLYGERLEDFTEFQVKLLQECCNRSMERISIPDQEALSGSSLPTSKPSAHFTSHMINSLDHTLFANPDSAIEHPFASAEPSADQYLDAVAAK